MKRSPLRMTVAVLVFVIGVPVLVVQRAAEGFSFSQAYDLVLVVGVIALVMFAKAIVDRSNPLRNLTQSRSSLRWHVDHLIEQSILGVGFVPKDAVLLALPGSQLDRLTNPQTPIDLFPPQHRSMQTAVGESFALPEPAAHDHRQPSVGGVDRPRPRN